MDSAYDCRQVVEIEEEPRHHLVFANEFVRGFAVEIAPGERTLCHHHPNDYLLYVASGTEIISAARDQEPKRLSYRAGECELSPAGLRHVVLNLGEKPFRNVVVELLPRARQLRRGSDPKRAPVGGDTTIAPISDDKRAAIFSLEIRPRASVEIFGPAVIATPFGNWIGQEFLAGEVSANAICDLAWVAPQREAVLWGSESNSEIAIVFQIGVND